MVQQAEFYIVDIFLHSTLMVHFVKFSSVKLASRFSVSMEIEDDYIILANLSVYI